MEGTHLTIPLLNTFQFTTIMPRPGGVSGKLADQYESLWTVHVALDVIEGRLQSITVEPFGDDSEGVEFYAVMTSGIRQYHSVKRQKVGGDWPLSKLCKATPSTGRSVLGDLFSKLKRWPDCKLCFVSATGANSLRELTERAQGSETRHEFDAQLTNKQLRRDFDDLVSLLCSCDRDEAFRAVKSLTVSLRDHEGLRDTVERRLESLLYRRDGTTLRPGDTRRAIAEFIVNNLGQTFTTNQLRSFIEHQGLGLRDWKLDDSVQDLVSKANIRYRESAETELINGTRIVRDVVRDITATLTTRDTRGALLVAPGGFGKSCVLAQCQERLVEQGVICLCMRMDTFSPAQTTAQLGEQMGLPKSPVTVLAGVADNSPSVLIIDQLDAISVVSGRNPRMWDVFQQLLREARQYPNIKLLLACRDFDLEHDHRLRQLADAQSAFVTFSLRKLTTDDVLVAIRQAAFGKIHLADRSMEILTVPFHLFLFLQGSPELDFATVDELYDRYWQRKQCTLRSTLGRDCHWNEVIDALTKKMSDRQSLIAPKAAVGNWTNDAVSMVSEHVLVEDNGQRTYRFFHESFFDYAFARRFCETDGDLIQLLACGEQHLFRRAQVRQILAYRRENDFGKYLDDLDTILKSKTVRFHIKRMVASGLRSIEDPRPEEWRLIEPFILEGDLSRHISLAIYNHVSWFDLLDSLGVFEAWLSCGGEGRIDRVLWFLYPSELHKARSVQIARLVSPYVTKGGEWTIRLKAIVSYERTHMSTEMSSIYLQMLQDGSFDDFNCHILGGDFWSQHLDAVKVAPKFLIDVLTTWFDRWIRISDGSAPGIFDSCPHNKSHTGALLVCNAAAAEPSYFAEQMFHRVRSVVLSTAVEYSGETRDRCWRSLANDNDPFYVHDAVLLALRRSLEHMAKNSPEVLRRHVETIVEKPHRTFAYLLLHAWTANPREFANDCAEYLLKDRRQLNVGYSHWTGKSSEGGVGAISRMAIKAISPHCSTELFGALEVAIIGYSDEYDRAVPRWRGYSELLRLRTLDSTRISQRARLRIEELERKFPGFPDSIVHETSSRGGKSAGSPLDQSVCEPMSDDQWISAMRKYDGTSDRHFVDLRKLATLVGEIARNNRVRFARLALRMPGDLNPAYFSAILAGICDRDMAHPSDENGANQPYVAMVTTDLIVQVIERVHGLPNQPCGEAIVEGVSKIADRQLPIRLLEIVSHYAVHDPDPECDIWKENVNGLQYHCGEPHAHGINCVRGQAAECLGRLLIADRTRFESLRLALVAIADDPVISVRTCAINAFLPLLDFASDFAVGLFLNACKDCEAICATPPFEKFVCNASRTQYPAIRDLLQFALRSTEPKAVENAARQIVLAELADADVGHDAEFVRTGDETMRTAAVSVYASNIADEEVGRRCVAYLRRFLNDDSEAVRREVSLAFRRLSGAKLLELEECIAEYIESRSFECHTDCLLHALNESNVALPQVICRAAERVLWFVRETGADVMRQDALIAHDISTLVVRQYEQATDESLRSRCLDLIDRMELVGYYGIADELAKLDR